MALGGVELLGSTNKALSAVLPGAPGCSLGCIVGSIVGSAAPRQMAPVYLLCYGRRLNRSPGWFLRAEPGPMASRTLLGDTCLVLGRTLLWVV